MDSEAFKKFPEFIGYLQHMAENRTGSRNTISTYSDSLKHFGEWLLAEHPHITDLKNVRKHHILSYQKWFVDHKKSSNTANIRLSVVRGLFAYLVYNDKLEDTPVPTILQKGGCSLPPTWPRGCE